MPDAKLDTWNLILKKLTALNPVERDSVLRSCLTWFEYRGINDLSASTELDDFVNAQREARKGKK